MIYELNYVKDKQVQEQKRCLSSLTSPLPDSDLGFKCLQGSASALEASTFGETDDRSSQETMVPFDELSCITDHRWSQIVTSCN